MDTDHEENEKLLPDGSIFYTSFPSTDESQEPIGVHLPDIEVKVYTRRWYILLMFSLLATTQTLVWNTWGPIQNSARLVYGWTQAEIAMLPNYGSIMFTLTVFGGAWLMEQKGLRLSVTLATGIVFVAAGLRCIPVSGSSATWVIPIAQIINGIAGSVPVGGPALVAAVWFPPQERTTATAFSSIAGYVGVAVSNIIGPLLVTQPPKINATCTPQNNCSFNSSSCTSLINITNATDTHFEVIKRDIERLMLIEFAIMGAVFLPILIYYPSHPPQPPSQSAAIKREDFKSGLCDILKHKSFWLIVLAADLPTGVYGVWGTVLDVNLDPLGISQDEAGWIGFYSTVAGCAAGLILGRFADIFTGHLKLILVVLSVGSLGSSIWYTLICEQYVAMTTVGIYISCILFGIFISGTVPLYYEFACEMVYPIGEGIACSVVTQINTIVGILFLLVFQIPNIGTLWMNWVLIGSIAISLPMLIISKEQYNRTKVDRATRAENSSVQ